MASHVASAYNRTSYQSSILFDDTQMGYIAIITLSSLCVSWDVMLLVEFNVFVCYNFNYRKTSNIIRTLVGNIIVDNSDVDGASPVGAAPTTSLSST